jgi:glycogen debranching enzyme
LDSDFIAPLKLPLYFGFDIQSTVEKLKNEMKTYYPETQIKLKETEVSLMSENPFAKDKDDILEDFLREKVVNWGCDERATTFDFKSVCEHFMQNAEQYSYELFDIVVRRMSTQMEEKGEGFVKDAIENIRKSILYEKIECKKNVISASNPLCPAYFTPLPNQFYAANNGWITFADPKENFATSLSHHYLRRNVVIWTDLIKLRYGEKKQDSVFLWKHMKKYVQLCAGMFHGFRIDNAHSTPLHVGEYFIRLVRKKY